MKERLKNPVLSQDFKKEQAVVLGPCLECKKPITDGYYGPYKDGGVCSKVCGILYMRKRNDAIYDRFDAGE